MTIRYDVIIPTLNAQSCIARLVESLMAQTIPPERILIVDSRSEDSTAQIIRSFGSVELLTVERREFDHGGTRDMAVRSCNAPFFVLMTQDALPVDVHCMESLLSSFTGRRIAAVCARQVAYPDARASERAVRAFRYTDQSMIWDMDDLKRLGVRAFLLSDVCTAYRRSAYLDVGGFEHPIGTNEDMLIAADFLRAGYQLAYSAQAQVWHSHNHTLRQEYERNKKIGEFLAHYEDRLPDAGEMGEGMRMVRQISVELLKGDRFGEWIAFGLNCVARLLGNRAGRREEGKRAKKVRMNQ